MFLKQSTAVTIKLGPFVDEGDGKTAETSLTISQADVRLSKNGGDMAQKNDSNACTHDEIGYYDCALNTTDTNTLGRLKVMVHESGALPVWADFMVLPANVYDSLIGGSDKLQVHADEITANLITSTAINDGAITAAKIGSDAITAAKIADGAIDAGAIASNAITDAKIAGGAITAAKFAAGAITATVIATDAIDADALAADAIAEINATVDTALADAQLDEFADLIEDNSGTYRFTEAALAQAPGGEGGGGSDSLENEVPGEYAEGTAGYVLGNLLDAIEDLFTETARAETADIPAANASWGDKLNFLATIYRNKKVFVKSSGVGTLYADDGSTAIGTQTTTDDGSTATVGEWVDAT